MGRNLEALLGGTIERASPDELRGDAAPPVPASTPDPAEVTVSAAPVVPAAPGEGVGFGAPRGEPVETGSGTAVDTPFGGPLGSGSAAGDARRPGDRLVLIGVERIRRGAWQPRRHFDPELLQELADSLRVQGMIQPVIVRALADGFELIAGERRWRAAQLAGLPEIPAIVRELDDPAVAAVSLIENIQRKDLNPLEEAEALARLAGEFGMTHQQVAEAVGRSRVAVSNLMRLLDLHEDVKTLVDRGELDMGHARALLGVEAASQPALARRIVEEGMTVRAAERLVRAELTAPDTATPAPRRAEDPDIERLSRSLGERLGAPVRIRHRDNGGGRLEIRYGSVSELEGILEHIR